MSKQQASFDYNLVFKHFLASDYCRDLFLSANLIGMYNPKKFFWHCYQIALTRNFSKFTSRTILNIFPNDDNNEMFEWAYRYKEDLKGFLKPDDIFVAELDKMFLNHPDRIEMEVKSENLKDIITAIVKVLADDFYKYCDEAGYLENGFESFCCIK